MMKTKMSPGVKVAIGLGVLVAGIFIIKKIMYSPPAQGIPGPAALPGGSAIDVQVSTAGNPSVASDYNQLATDVKPFAYNPNPAIAVSNTTLY